MAPSDCPSFNYPPDQKPCAYGIAQCIEYPGKYYADNGIALTDQRMQYIKGCGGYNYNPFDPGMSACCGAKKFGENLRGQYGAENYIKNNWDYIKSSQEGGKCAEGMNSDEKGWAAYYLASNMYFGAEWAKINDFLLQPDYDNCCANSQQGACYQNYIEYLRARTTSLPAPGNAYGAQVMSRFRAAVTTCSSDCPK